MKKDQKQKGSKNVTLKSKEFFIYRDDASKFNLSYRIHALDMKQPIGNYLYKVRVEQLRLIRKDVAKQSGVSVRNLINIETGYGASMDAVMRVYLFYVFTGVLSDESQGQFLEFYHAIWMQDSCQNRTVDCLFSRK
ncbi:hypothetical protein [Bacteroides sp. 51]|uniref:hypothetical protein n=1 Tax=Bacteroides sp. 51 TaxID=2302938 RepID=UPI0013D0F8AA|nr:hypothetical protein [Bacteroides sp. 51]NDV83877.1 hypothetical protein [Bacteroides sp. 51]